MKRDRAAPTWRARHALARALARSLGHSIKRRLVLLFVLLAIGTACVFLFGLQRILQSGWQAYARPLVADYVDRLAADIGSPPDLAKARALADALPITVRIDGPQVRWNSQPDARHGAAGSNHDADDPPHGNGSARGPATGWSMVRTTADGHRIRFGLARAPDDARPRLVGWLTLVALLTLTALAYATVRRLLAPLGEIARGVEAYGRGEFTAPIRVRRRDELGALAGRINGMAGNLSGMLDAKRALLLAISHELRSPLTRARVNAELVDEGPARDALLADLAEMRELITSLLESERLAQGHAALQAESTDLAALARDLVASQFEGQPLSLRLDVTIGPVRADPTRLRLLLRNLIANALRHSADAPAPPEVFLRREGDGRIALGVRDHGPGVPDDEQLARLGEAFYRPDSARARSSGGVGLGLYLCRLVAQAHGGELRIRRAEPGLELSALLSPASG